jgi:hypothetical protein
MPILLISKLLAPAIVLAALAGLPSEAEKIEALIQSVAHLSNAKFVRNGTEYDATAAANHLRTKLENAGSRVKTAEDFIRYCGSTSSISGKPYEIRYDDGRVITSEAFLRAQLAELEKPRSE